MCRIITSMRPLPLVVLSFLLATTALAQNADLEVTVEAPATTRIGEEVRFRVTVRNNGPDPAPNVRMQQVTHPIGFYEPCRDESASLGTLAPGRSVTVDCSITVQRIGIRYEVDVFARADSDVRDPAWENSSDQKRVVIVTAPDLIIFGQAPLAVMPALPFPLSLQYINAAYTPAVDTVITVDIPTRFSKVPENCTVSGTRATCNVGALEQHTGAHWNELQLEVVAPDASDAHFVYDIAIQSNVADEAPQSNTFASATKTFKTFFVTNTSDTGSGSLRNAIESANASCLDVTTPCAIAFRIPTAGQSWHTIRPASTLPSLVAVNVHLDATTQTAYFGDTNPVGPEIEINGSEAGASQGLHVFTPCTAQVRGLAINGFRGNGLVLTSYGDCSWSGPFASVSESYIGTDPTGTHAVPNDRGIWIGGTNWSLANNVISGNRYAGVFIDQGAVAVRKNIIGLTRALDAPLGNGASGVFVGIGASGTDIIDNYIGFNGHFGVSIARAARNVALYGNSFQANHQLAIDFGLDGASTSVPVPIPVVVSATYENGATRIVIATERVPSEHNGSVFMVANVYANDVPDPTGYGEGQYFLGAIQVSSQPTVFIHQGDLRGKWIAATSTVREVVGFSRGPRTEGNRFGLFDTTSEFSRSVEVK